MPFWYAKQGYVGVLLEYMGVEPKIGGIYITPQIIHSNGVFPYFHHPFWGVFPLFLETPICIGDKSTYNRFGIWYFLFFA